MSYKIDYTTTAQRFSSKYPLLTRIATQMNFWIMANLLLAVILHLQKQALGISEPIQVINEILFGMLYGACVGTIDFYFEKSRFGKIALGKLILLRTLYSLGILILLLNFIPYNLPRYITALIVIYYFFMTIVIHFIIHVNKKYGPGILLPLLLGKYRIPIEEERIFMFMDLKSSTTLAEKLGHLKYSAFIRDCFADINHVVSFFNAEIYQYVGDEIVLSWKMKEGIKNASCIRFFFACQECFNKRTDYYQHNYGLLPQFKAGLHGGIVTAVEIGDIRRDIAYHGDVLNIAARIQSLCNEHGKTLLISAELLWKLKLDPYFWIQSLGTVSLRGKKVEVEITSVEADPIKTN